MSKTVTVIENGRSATRQDIKLAFQCYIEVKMADLEQRLGGRVDALAQRMDVRC